MTEEFFYHRKDGIFHRIMLDQIVFLEAAENNVKFHVPAAAIFVRTSMDAALNQLPQNEFVQIHRSFALAIAYIGTIARDTVSFIGAPDVELPVSKTDYPGLWKRIKIPFDTLNTKKLILILFFIPLLIDVFAQSNLKGTFVGLEEMKGYSDSSRPDYKWYHLSILTFKQDSVFLEQSPIAIYKRDTIFSASVGGFYSYGGTIVSYQGKPFLDLTLISCNYCPTEVMGFTPPKIVKDDDVIRDVTNERTAIAETIKIDYPNRKYRIMLFQKTKNNDVIIIDKNVFKRRKTK